MRWSSGSEACVQALDIDAHPTEPGADGIGHNGLRLGVRRRQQRLDALFNFPDGRLVARPQPDAAPQKLDAFSTAELLSRFREKVSEKTWPEPQQAHSDLAQIAIGPV